MAHDILFESNNRVVYKDSTIPWLGVGWTISCQLILCYVMINCSKNIVLNCICILSWKLYVCVQFFSLKLIK